MFGPILDKITILMRFFLEDTNSTLAQYILAFHLNIQRDLFLNERRVLYAE